MNTLFPTVRAEFVERRQQERRNSARRTTNGDRRTLITAANDAPERRTRESDRRGFDRRIGFDRRGRAEQRRVRRSAMLELLPVRSSYLGRYVDVHA